jgi:hypothetical protein
MLVMRGASSTSKSEPPATSTERVHWRKAVPLFSRWTSTVTLKKPVAVTAPGGSRKHEKELASEWESATAVSPFWSSSREKQPRMVPLSSCWSLPSTSATPLRPPSIPCPVTRKRPPG